MGPIVESPRGNKVSAYIVVVYSIAEAIHDGKQRPLQNRVARRKKAFQDMSSRDIQKKKGLQEPQTTAVCCGKSNGATIVGT